MIAYDWPPSGAVGGVRAVKIAKCLADNGWHPYVLTVKADCYERIQSGWQWDSRITVLRTYALPRLEGRYGVLKERLRRWFKYDRVGQFNRVDLHGGSKTSITVSLPGRFKRMLLSFLLIPDEFQGWLPFAIHRGLHTLNVEGIRHVISTGPPFTAHLAGLILKNVKKDIRWITDFRDPWACNTQRPIAMEELAERINAWLEARVVRAADKVVSVTPAMTDWYRKRYMKIPEHCFSTITNGVEYEEFQGLTKRSTAFTVSYIGSIEYERSPESVFRAIAELCEEGIVNKRDVRLRLIGKCAYMQARKTEDVLAQYGLSDIAEVQSLVPRREALQAMVDSDILLLLADAQPLQVPGKAYEYIASGAFIVAITEEMSATSDLMKRVGRSACLRGDDIKGIKQTIRLQYENWKKDTCREFSRVPWRIEDYDWSLLGRLYATTVDSNQ